MIMTVAGPIDPAELGVALPHEHVMVDFIGAGKVSPDRYDQDEVARVALPHLVGLREAGCATLVECTPEYIGRDASLLRRLSAVSGLHVLTNTGYYGAADDKFLPPHAHTETADELAARWLGEWEAGIGGSDVRPGFIKIGVDAGPLSEVDGKLVRAAARAHAASGLAIASHTGDGEAALGQLRVLREEGVHPNAFIWVHAQNAQDADLHARAAEAGAWVEFDGVPWSEERHVQLVLEMQRRGLLARVLLSQDAGWYHVGEPGGGTFRPFAPLLTDFLPRLRAAGLSDDDLEQITVRNPRDAFAVRVRPAV